MNDQHAERGPQEIQDLPGGERDRREYEAAQRTIDAQVKTLRSWAQQKRMFKPGTVYFDMASACDEAADEIERLRLQEQLDQVEKDRLRAALEAIAVHTDYPAVGCEQHMMDMARKAIGMETA